MIFSQKLQLIRKNKGLIQEKLDVSRHGPVIIGLN